MSVININNVPNDKVHAKIHLKAMKQAIEEVLNDIEVYQMKAEPCVTGGMYTRINEINKLLKDY